MRLDAIQFDTDSKNFAGGLGFQEVDENGTLVHLYDQFGDQLDSGNGNFPSATWTLIETVGTYDAGDTDSFWATIASHKNSVEA